MTHTNAVFFSSLMGAAAVITGLYVVLWGKADDMKRGSEPATAAAKPCSDSCRDVECTAAEEPLLADAVSSDQLWLFTHYDNTTLFCMISKNGSTDLCSFAVYD